jgi:hypothetical protein
LSFRKKKALPWTGSAPGQMSMARAGPRKNREVRRELARRDLQLTDDSPGKKFL